MALSSNRIRLLQEFGQSVWLNELHRGLLRRFHLQRLIEEDGVSGIAPDPVGLKSAILRDPSDVLEIFRRHSWTSPVGARELYEQLIIQEARDAADAFTRLYEQSDARDGIVCLPFMPRPDGDSRAIVIEAQRLWQTLDRPNAMITVPATASGVAALQELVAGGINVNATLLFSVRRYLEVLDAFASGLEERVKADRPLNSVTSVAGFFVSRIDPVVDAKLASLRKPDEISRAGTLLGKAGTGIAQLAYQELKKFNASARWRALASCGAKPQKLLWTSTSTQHPASELRYVDELIGPETISAVSLSTLSEYRDNGQPRPTLEADLYETAVLPADLREVGIDLESIGERLESETLEEFALALEASVSEIETKCASM